MDDERLATLAASGDERAFGVLVQRHQARLFTVSRSVLRSDDDARDAVQNALLKAFHALQAGQLRGAPRPWLARIAHNEARSLARVRRDYAPLDESLLDAGGDPQDEVLVKEQLAFLVADVASLPERLRRPLLLRADAGLPYGAIARELAVSESAARRAVSDARAALEADAAAREDVCAEIRTILRGDDRRRHRSRRVRGHLRTCEPCRAWRPARRQFLLAPLGFLVSAMEWISTFFAAGGGSGAAAALRSSAVVAAVASGSLALTIDKPASLKGAHDHEVAAKSAPEPAPKRARVVRVSAPTGAGVPVLTSAAPAGGVTPTASRGGTGSTSRGISGSPSARSGSPSTTARRGPTATDRSERGADATRGGDVSSRSGRFGASGPRTSRAAQPGASGAATSRRGASAGADPRGGQPGNGAAARNANGSPGAPASSAGARPAQNGGAHGSQGGGRDAYRVPTGTAPTRTGPSGSGDGNAGSTASADAVPEPSQPTDPAPTDTAPAETAPTDAALATSPTATPTDAPS